MIKTVPDFEYLAYTLLGLETITIESPSDTIMDEICAVDATSNITTPKNNEDSILFPLELYMISVRH